VSNLLEFNTLPERSDAQSVQSVYFSNAFIKKICNFADDLQTKKLVIMNYKFNKMYAKYKF